MQGSIVKIRPGVSTKMQEIERKFLVTSEGYKAQSQLETPIVQGFLNTHPDRTVRVRIMGEQGFITVKGRSNKEGTTRFEWETEITVSDAEALLDLCEEGTVAKVRYHVKVADHLFEVDVFEEDNEGLIVAEVELKSADEDFQKPDWLGAEVTGETKYYNSQLSINPFKNWNHE